MAQHPPIDVHVHVHYDEAELTPVLTKLEELGTQMADLQAAIDAMKARAVEDYQHLRDLLDQALATDTADQAEIARLRAEADAVVAAANEFDLDPSNPPAPPQPDVPEPTPEP